MTNLEKTKIRAEIIAEFGRKPRWIPLIEYTGVGWTNPRSQKSSKRRRKWQVSELSSYPFA